MDNKLFNSLRSDNPWKIVTFFGTHISIETNILFKHAVAYSEP